METIQKKQLVNSLAEALSQNSIINKVYGEPIEVQGKTIIPVAKLSLGFGGGFGKNKGDTSLKTNSAEPKSKGGGLGGGLRINPTGVIEITPSQTRFINFNNVKYFAFGIVAGFFISKLSQRARKRHHSHSGIKLNRQGWIRPSYEDFSY